MKLKKMLFATVVFMAITNLVSCVVLDAGKADKNSAKELKLIEKLHSIADPSLPAEKRAELIMAQMSLEDKITIIGGNKSFYINAFPQYGLREVEMADATMGLRNHGEVTAFPGAVAMAASWNRDLMFEVGNTIAKECRAKGCDILLAPGVNIYRVPNCGRNFEYFGEDPYLAGEMVVNYIKGLQDLGIMATIKHFVANNSDYDRNRMSSDVDERTLREIYYPAFKKAVQEGGSWALMTSYNPVNGISASENKQILDVLKKEWGYKGIVMADWESVYNAYEPFIAGLDLEMPGPRYMNKKNLMPLLKSGKITEAQLDDKVKRILTACLSLGIYDRPAVDSDFKAHDEDNKAVALKVGHEGAVLLKNDNNLLPLDRDDVKKIAIVGPNAKGTPTSGGGAGWVIPTDPVDFVSGMKEGAGENIQVRKVLSSSSFVKEADAVFVCVGFKLMTEMESMDREWKMPASHINLIKSVAAKNPNTIVVITAGGGVETESWINDVAGVLHTFYMGEHPGTVLADIAFGDVNPSGKLPFSMIKKYEDNPATSYYLPAGKSLFKCFRPLLFGSKVMRRIWNCEYGEGIYLGYRHHDTKDVAPQFEFGYGLTYTSFDISNAVLSSSTMSGNSELTVTLDVTNTGVRDGAEIVQLYVHDKESTLDRPEKELKNFVKVFLEVGETKTVSMTIDKADLSYYNPELSGWVAESGEFELRIGNSSKNITQTLNFSYTE